MADRESMEKKLVQRYGRGWVECQSLGRHFYVRDRLFGVIPVGRPYCMWCGAEVRRG